MSNLEHKMLEISLIKGDLHMKIHKAFKTTACGCSTPAPEPVCEGTQTHVHKYEGSTKLAEEEDDRHNHRFAGVSSHVIPQPCGGHKHALLTNTDFFENHHHEVGALSGLAIVVGPNDKHVHFVDGNTTLDDSHFHLFQFTTLIQSPLT